MPAGVVEHEDDVARAPPRSAARNWPAALRRAACSARCRWRIEKVFGTRRRSHGLRRMRWIGLAKVGLLVRLAAMAYNLQRTVTLLRSTAA